MSGRRHSRYGYRPRARARVGRELPGRTLAATAVLTVVATLVALWLGPVREATRTVLIPEPPDVVWQLLTDLDNLPTWRRGLTRVERLPDLAGMPAWLEYRGVEKEAVRVAEAARPFRLVTERVSDAGVTASWQWELARLEGGSRLTLTRRVTLQPVGQRIVNGLLRRTGREVDQALADLSFRLDLSSRMRTTALNR